MLEFLLKLSSLKAMIACSRTEAQISAKNSHAIKKKPLE